MDLRDIPDRWKRFNPETPPYKYFPNRTRKQTMVWSWMAMAGFSAFGYLLAEIVERQSVGKEEQIKEYARQNASIEQVTMIKNQSEAFKEIMMRARRQRLGLPPQAHGSVDMRDPFDE
eukprot:CAMPEP_0183436294 /NCGR_PEP_ID=MMETSP0370-20130417/69174_1 /TAXON_ID=268820 /ORGANISM="Peridinium aciculiferum, Strain PAER-2" /LENGTH=117 /DNA_ID=CAMNT_0025623685 /DNA_START=59 /DNA_END=412 /DNA_ORIENTATION=+